MKPDAIDTEASTEWHDGRIPGFVAPVLETLYGSLYSSLPQLALGGLDNVNTYCAQAAGRPQALYLFVREGAAARVINEGMAVAGADADRFAGQLFGRYREIKRIEFHAVALNGKPAGWPALCFTLNEDIVIALPDSEASYLASLGKSIRKSLRQNLARAPRLAHRVIPGCDVDGPLVDQIIAFNHGRLAAKQHRSALDRVAALQLLELVQAQGMAGIVTLDERLCAGTLACRIGSDVYSLVNAHDPSYDRLSLGNLSRYLMITAAIRSGARRFHLLGGNFRSKRTWGAERQPLHHLVIYRDSQRLLANLPRVAFLALREQRYQLGMALEDDGTEMTDGRWPPRWLTRLARRLHHLKRSLHTRSAAAR